MVSKKISKKVIFEFYQDILRWESMLGYASDELLFLDKLLHAEAFENGSQIKMEELLRLKQDIKTKKQEIIELTPQMELSKNNVGAFLECDETSDIEFSFKNYKVLKRNFTLFNTSYNQYKTEIFKYTGGVL